MRIAILLLLLAAGMPVLRAQTADEAAIKARIDAFTRWSNEEDWSSAFDLLYPKLFTYVRKEELVGLMDTLVSDGMHLRTENLRIRTFSLPIREGRETFVRVAYVADMIVRIDAEGKYGPPEILESVGEQFRKTYGKDNVVWVPESREYRIVAEKAMIAVRGDDRPDWYLVEINTDQPELMAFLFSPEVLARLVSAD
jgi:hypothetical protein